MSTRSLLDSPNELKALSKGKAIVAYLNADHWGEHEEHYHNILGFSGQEPVKNVTLLSEIHNMPGHYVVVGKNGEVVSGLHGDIFEVEID